ncbi:MAG TPA: indolepyruvate oxidoreductase subunit beta [Clostridia bacterium]|nr:indolepyruvate oxidoreductase subunit beta [Clostridia bacterium]
MKMELNILIVGVGGQGTLLASRIIGMIAADLGLDCKLSEVHGMAQRGGSVVTHAKVAEVVTSPIIALHDADIIIAFEKLEALRYTNFLKEEGTIVVNNQEIFPMPVITGVRDYPQDIVGELKLRAKKVIVIDALKIAEEIGNDKTVNVIMLGALAKYLGIAKQVVLSALKKCVKPQFFSINELALEKGYELE